MNCQYCNIDCQQTYKTNDYYIYACKPCDVRFLVNLSEEIKGIELCCQKELSNYSIRLYLTHNKTSVFFLAKVIDENGEHFKNKYFKQLVTSFDSIMDVTPTNIKDKLQTILTFL
jgi:hypothetical protein